MTDVTVVGDIVIDIVARLESFPPPGGDAQSTETAVHLGGTSLNTAVMLTRLGMRAALLGRVGADVFGDLAIDRLRQIGLSTDWIERDPAAATALAYIAVTPDGQRTMMGGSGANRYLQGTGLADKAVGAARWLHLTSYNAMSPSSLGAAQRAANLFAARRMPISIDLGMAPSRLRLDEVKQLAACADVVMPSESTTLETARSQVVAKKCGARGCEVFCPGEDWIMVPGFAVDIIDTTDAGDSFDAGFIAGRLRGLDNRTSALLANACGAAACTVWGAGDALPAADVVARLLGDRVPHGWQTEAQQARSALGL